MVRLPPAQVPSVLQPMVLSLSLEVLVDRRTVQEDCQQAQLHKFGQAAKLLQSVQVRLRRERHTGHCRTTPPHPRTRAPQMHHVPIMPLRPACPTPRDVPTPVVQAQAVAKIAGGLDERNVQARPSPPILHLED